MRDLLLRFLRRRLDPSRRYGLRLTLLALAFLLVTLPFGFLVEQVLKDGRVYRLDLSVARRLHAFVTGEPALRSVSVALSAAGNVFWLYGLTAATAIVLWLRRVRRLAVFVATTVFVGGAVHLSVKVLVGRPRPIFDEPLATAYGKSFPSGHTVLSTIVYGALLLAFLPLVARRLRPWTIAGVCMLVLLVGASRLTLGVHYLTDVAGGLVFGIAWLAASTAAFELWRADLGYPRPRVLREGVEPEETIVLLPLHPP